ncbi:MAG: cell division protein ZapA [Sphingobacteriia bacterium]|nr:cell division protein ZapA [Sphingobacteriia bacterium]NCC39253.1 cell division protein ZapA [Gammaproteobacteria bacterium]
MTEEPVQVSIRILDKDYRIACGSGEEEGLRESARLLDRKMREIRQSGRVIGSDRIAVMAALNIAYDFVQLKRVSPISETEMEHRLAHLQARLAHALSDEPRLDAPLERV